MDELQVLSVNISEEKGTVKQQVDQIRLTNKGIYGDAHSGPWNRMVSLLGVESINKFSKEAGREINFGEFAENITTKGKLLHQTLPLDKFVNDKIELEVTQIGKKCHGTNCKIFKEVGNCVMPKEGIFARVIKEGSLKPGELIFYHPRIIKTTIITLSDRASKGLYPDLSGKVIKNQISQFWKKRNRNSQIDYVLIPDDQLQLEESVKKAIKNQSDFIFTTGGTGIGPRDITPDVLTQMFDKEIPGIMDLIRIKYGSDLPAALISRSVAGIIGKTLIYCLPGSQKAVQEYLNEILKTVLHSLYMVHQLDLH